jgi:site-specific recombinase XerD
MGYDRLINRKDKGAEARRMMKKDVLPFIGELDIRDVRKLHVAEITDRLLQRNVKRMAKVVFSLIRQMFRFAVTRDLLESDPTAMVSKKNIGGANIERERVLSEEEIGELARKLPLSQMTEMNGLAKKCIEMGNLLSSQLGHLIHIKPSF